ncbi:hypothetical protein Cni_G16634 [Canna indica]|uniref:Non-specific lipid-transfer protein n=1 Tax=Canna indica TaxID=4628 RepID=A0AAQ3KFH4_9LILI|nr:hypothetical protein Cni_G16634 [Canna indica]
MRKVIAVLLLAALAVAGPVADAAVTCVHAMVAIKPCLEFVTGQQPKPSAACCSGVQQLKEKTTTTAERRATCACLEMAAKQFQNIVDKYLSVLSSECSIEVPFSFSVSTNCQE